MATAQQSLHKSQTLSCGARQWENEDDRLLEAFYKD